MSTPGLRFYLGTHKPTWLERLDVPLFVSHRTLGGRRRLPVAATPWALDSGGFTELSLYGEWRTTTAEYVRSVRRYVDEIGELEWAAPMDAMCEPWILDRARSWLGGTVDAHQTWTTHNFLELRTMAPELPFIPVLQGWTIDDYLRHVELYERAGVRLTDYGTVGIGSVCRRQASAEIGRIVETVSALGIGLHGFGVKSAGLVRYGHLLASADSLAWSYGGRRIRPCTERPELASCSNCVHHAMAWRADVLDRLSAHRGNGACPAHCGP
jgi:hypothetical protein